MAYLFLVKQIGITLDARSSITRSLYLLIRNALLLIGCSLLVGPVLIHAGLIYDHIGRDSTSQIYPSVFGYIRNVV